MKSEWKVSTIEQVCNLVTDGAHYSPPSVERGEYMVSVKDFTEYGFDFTACRKISKEDYDKLYEAGCVPQKKDILVGKDGARFFEDIILYKQEEKPALLSSIAILRVDEKQIIPAYLYYYLKTPNIKKDVRDNYGSGSAIPRIVLKDFKRMPVSYPPLPIQRKIASILSALDDKIETNNAICRNLEEQAIALYKSRLIDSIPFERIEDSHEKTTGWRIGTVDDVVEFLDSRRVPLSKSQREKMEKKYPYYGATELMDYVDNYLFDGIFLLLGEDGTVQDEHGYPILQYVWGKFWVNNHAHVLAGKGKWTVELLYLLFANTKVSSVVTGAVQPKISQNRLRTLPVVIPPDNILDALEVQIAPLFAKMRILHDENHRLANMRDTLLPTLMSGELEVETLV